MLALVTSEQELRLCHLQAGLIGGCCDVVMCGPRVRLGDPPQDFFSFHDLLFGSSFITSSVPV